MQKLLINLLVFCLGLLLYALMILTNEPVLGKIIVCEFGSAALFVSSYSMLQSVKGKPEEGE